MIPVEGVISQPCHVLPLTVLNHVCQSRWSLHPKTKTSMRPGAHEVALGFEHIGSGAPSEFQPDQVLLLSLQLCTTLPSMAVANTSRWLYQPTALGVLSMLPPRFTQPEKKYPQIVFPERRRHE